MEVAEVMLLQSSVVISVDRQAVIFGSRELYNEHRGYYSVGAKDIKRGNPDELNSDEKDTINVVLRDYGDMEAYELRELTHSETPWLKARNGLPDGASSDAIITKAAMSEYYGAL